MPLINDFQVLELMLLVLISKHCTVTAYWFSTSVTIVIKLCLMFGTHFFAVICILAIILKILNHVRDLFKNSKVNELRNTKRCPTVGALLPSLC